MDWAPSRSVMVYTPSRSIVEVSASSISHNHASDSRCRPHQQARGRTELGQERRFRRSTNVSAKVALAVSPFFLFSMLITEQTMHRANLNPQAYGIGLQKDATLDTGTASKRGGQLLWYHKVANHLYEHPYRMLAYMGIPAVGGIAWSLRNEGHLKFSQKVMHTRVYGQMTILSMLITMMIFRESMTQNGGLFIAEGGQGDESDSEGGLE
ncbi:unnamed protein product [Discosporangium mesarthrocarpum]